MIGKICTPNEYTSMSDLHNVDVSVEGKFGRVILKCYKDDLGMDRFEFIIEPKSNTPEPGNVISVGNEHMIICRGLIDFNNVVNLIDTMRNEDVGI